VKHFIGLIVVLLQAACSGLEVKSKEYESAANHGGKQGLVLERLLAGEGSRKDGAVTASGWSGAGKDKSGRLQVHVYVTRLTPVHRKTLEDEGARIQPESPSLKAYQAWASPEIIEKLVNHDFVIRVASSKNSFHE